VIAFTDISERVRMERAMRVAEERFRHSFDRAPIGIALVSLQGRFQRVNAALCELTGHPERELLRLRLQDITHVDDLEAAEGYMSELIAGERSAYEMEKRCLHADGHVIGIQMNGTLVRDADGTQQYVIAQVQDISRRRAIEEQLQQTANQDPLTDLSNRRGFEYDFERTLAYATRYERLGAVLLIDLDGFKAVNDTLGHQAGDDLLLGIAASFRERLRASDLIGRLGDAIKLRQRVLSAGHGRADRAGVFLTPGQPRSDGGGGLLLAESACYGCVEQHLLDAGLPRRAILAHKLAEVVGGAAEGVVSHALRGVPDPLRLPPQGPL